MSWDWAAVSGFVGVVAGSGLTHWASMRQQRAAQRERIEDQRVELYAEWFTAMNRNVYNNKAHQPTDTLRNKLMLIERDANLRNLIEEAYNAIPDGQTAEGQEFYYECTYDPEASWPTFDQAIEKLTEAVRASLHR